MKVKVLIFLIIIFFLFTYISCTLNSSFNSSNYIESKDSYLDILKETKNNILSYIEKNTVEDLVNIATLNEHEKIYSITSDNKNLKSRSINDNLLYKIQNLMNKFKNNSGIEPEIYIYVPDIENKGNISKAVVIDKISNYENIWVGYDPMLDDKDVQFIKVFDINNNIKYISAWEKPDFPVIIVGLHENINSTIDLNKSNKLIGDGETLVVKKIMFDLNKDKKGKDICDYFWCSNAEFYIKVYYPYNNYLRSFDFTYVNRDYTTYNTNTKLIHLYPESYGLINSRFVLKCYDDDSNSDDNLGNTDIIYAYRDVPYYSSKAFIADGGYDDGWGIHGSCRVHLWLERQ